MREFRVKRFAGPDGFCLELFDPVPLASSPVDPGVQVPPTGNPGSTGDDDESTDKEAAEEKDLEVRWNAYWERLTYASGAGIPPFPGVESARRRLGP